MDKNVDKTDMVSEGVNVGVCVAICMVTLARDLFEFSSKESKRTGNSILDTVARIFSELRRWASAKAAAR